MSTPKTMEQLTHVFQEVFDDQSIALTPDMVAEDVPEWDSFNHINLIVAVEQETGIHFDPTELEEMKNVGELADAIDRKQKEKA